MVNRGAVLKTKREDEMSKWGDARYSTIRNVNRNCHSASSVN